ncbi:formylglycine-generating enzyme family protein, partial [bacterium]|nr:formylglycine-generating enzyme family protein [bacterium]
MFKKFMMGVVGNVAAGLLSRQWKRIKDVPILFFAATLVLLLLGTVPNRAYANNVSVTNVTMTNLDKAGGNVDIQFDISQGNTYRLNFNGKEFYDSIWLFVKFSTAGAQGPWRHAYLASGGNITPAADGKGAFLVPQATEGQTASWSDTSKTLRWDFTNAGNESGALTGNESIRVKVFGIEMVKVPTDSFYYNYENAGSTYTFNQYADGVTTPVWVDATTDIPSGAAAGWPNGYSTFYLAKYEVSQQQYCDFLNTLPGFWNNTGTALARFPNNVTYEHGIYHAGSEYAVGASTANRASNFLSWDDTRVYLSWSACRPMTEMEFEKAARGGGNQRKYPWGNTEPSVGNSLYLPSGHAATYNCWKFFANYVEGANEQGVDGPTSVGLYLSGDETRTNEQKGCSPYGIA